MEVRDWTYEDFPEFTDIPEGAGVICSDGEEMGVHLYPDVEYKTVDGITLHLEILRPFTRNADEQEILPCVVYVQGSAWMEQAMYRSLPLYAGLAERGYVVACVEYRHSGRAAFPATVIDTRNAIRFMRANAKTYGIDEKKIIVGGCSSGGHAAVFAGIRHNDDTPENAYPGISAEVSGILNMYGSVSVMTEDANPTTLNHLLPDSPEGMEAGRINLREHPEIRKAMSAECNIFPDTDIAPMLIIHGTKDRTVNASLSAVLYQRLMECGKDASLYYIQGADHGGAEFWTDAVLDVIEKFIKKVI